MAEAYSVFASYLRFKEVLSDPLGHLYRANLLGDAIEPPAGLTGLGHQVLVGNLDDVLAAAVPIFAPILHVHAVRSGLIEVNWPTDPVAQLGPRVACSHELIEHLCITNRFTFKPFELQ